MACAPGGEIIYETADLACEPRVRQRLLHVALECGWAVAHTKGEARPHEQIIGRAHPGVLHTGGLQWYLPKTRFKVEFYPPSPLPDCAQHVFYVRNGVAVAHAARSARSRACSL